MLVFCLINHGAMDKQTKLHIFSIKLGLPCGSKILFIVKAITLNGAILSPFPATKDPIYMLYIGSLLQLHVLHTNLEVVCYHLGQWQSIRALDIGSLRP